MAVIVWQLDLQLLVPSVRIPTKVVSSNPFKAMYSIQHYVITFASDLRQTGRWFPPRTPVSNKTDHHDITDILLNVALSSIYQTKPSALAILRDKLHQFSHNMSSNIQSFFIVLNVACVCRLSIFDCPFDFLSRLFII